MTKNEYEYKRCLEPLAECVPAPAPAVSFEFFPPKTEESAKTLWESIRRLAPLSPRFVSVTYGAGGSTRSRTHETVVRIKKETRLEPAAHLTCVNATRAELDSIVRSYLEAGISHIVALRGDPPDENGSYVPTSGGYGYAADLVAGIRRISESVEISVAAYPEGHPESPSQEADLDVLARKVDAGATRAITQFFFKNEAFLRFRDRVIARGIDVELVPGILPVTNFHRVAEFAGICGAEIPAAMASAFEGLEEAPKIRRLVAAALAVDQCRALQNEGVNCFHFYTLNRADLTYALCHMLGQRPAEPGSL